MNTNLPLFFAPNRVWRLYTGGLLLDRFTGAANESDSHLPEEWLASTVLANNGQHSLRSDEGLARIIVDKAEGPSLMELLLSYGEEILGKKHYAKYRQSTAVLCKYLDSAIRLPIQCHPDADTSRRLFNSPFGKTESWHIISTRTINGEEPYILLGFKTGIKQEAFAKAVYDQDIEAMINMLHRIRVKPGDTYFVPARMPHAIGTGVFMLEVQEPSDWVIQPEQYCADIKLNDRDMWCSLSPEQGLQVFDYSGFTSEELLKKVAPSNRIIQKTKNSSVVELIGNQHTKAFGLWKASITGKTLINLPTEFAIIIVEKGAGTISWSGGSRQIKRSDCFLKPATLKGVEFSAENELEFLVCLPPASIS